jgi:hypothetical protein
VRKSLLKPGRQAGSGRSSAACRSEWIGTRKLFRLIPILFGIFLTESSKKSPVEFKRNGFAFVSIGPATRLTISVEPPATTHELTVGKLQAWLDTNGKTPREQATKVTLRQLLGRV